MKAWFGVVAVSIVVVFALVGCSSSDPAPNSDGADSAAKASSEPATASEIAAE